MAKESKILKFSQGQRAGVRGISSARGSKTPKAKASKPKVQKKDKK